MNKKDLLDQLADLLYSIYEAGVAEGKATVGPATTAKPEGPSEAIRWGPYDYPDDLSASRTFGRRQCMTCGSPFLGSSARNQCAQCTRPVPVYEE
jgi:hypothetical protein